MASKRCKKLNPIHIVDNYDASFHQAARSWIMTIPNDNVRLMNIAGIVESITDSSKTAIGR